MSFRAAVPITYAERLKTARQRPLASGQKSDKRGRASTPRHRFHPNASGHRLWADAVYAPLLDACRHIASTRQPGRKTVRQQAG